MADNVLVDNGAGTDYTVSTDEVDMGGGTAQVQYFKLADGTQGSSVAITATSDGSMNTESRRDILFAQITSGSLTTATTAYTAGDQVGSIFTITSAARATGGTGRILAVTLHDETDIIGPYDVVFFRSSVTLASDNAAFAISDSDANLACGIVQLAGAYDIGNNRIAQAQNLYIPYACTGGTSLFAALICRAGHTFFGATTSLKLDVWLERD